MPRLPMTLAATVLLAALAGACQSSGPAALTDQDASAQVSHYLSRRTWSDPQVFLIPVRFSEYFSILAIEVLETTIDGDVARVRCDIALAPLAPIPADARESELFSNIVGPGAKSGPLIVTHTFTFRLLDAYWLIEAMVD